MTAPLIALLTDFGLTDTYVGSLKAAIFGVAPEAKIVDVCHHISPQNVLEGAFVLRMVYRDYPAGTIFVAVIDPGVGTPRKALLMQAGDYFFIGPDNGILSYPYQEESVGALVSLEKKKFFRQPTSNTFHGRDIFAPCAAALSQGVKPSEFGPQLDGKPKLLDLPIPRFDNDKKTLRGQIMRTDRFGNLVSNIHRNDLEKDQQDNGSLAIEIVDWSIPMTPHYTHNKEDPLCALWGSAGFLEIAAQEGSAHEILDVMPAEPITVRFT